MAAGSANFAALCKRVLQQCLLSCSKLNFIPQVGSSQRLRTRDSAGTFHIARAHPRSGDELVERARDVHSKGSGMDSGEQRRTTANNPEGRLATLMLQRSFEGTTRYGSSSSLRQFSTSNGSNGFSDSPTGSVVAVGVSGGVDSSIAALLLQRQGYKVFGIFMRNWDSSDEAGSTACSLEQDYEDAQRVCKHLGIKLYKVDYHRRYWMDVFESFTRDCALGLTPNPDLACNQHIKKTRKNWEQIC